MTVVCVARRDNDSDERMIKRFMKKIKKYGVITEVLNRRFFVKPSTKKRLAKKKLRADYLKNQKKQGNI
tara:strand:- start:4545 stop:4751 length:207 start_codon:yes stop_codon:yes gene_type:complete